jgi:hypothetical protein
MNAYGPGAIIQEPLPNNAVTGCFAMCTLTLGRRTTAVANRDGASGRLDIREIIPEIAFY